MTRIKFTEKDVDLIFVEITGVDSNGNSGTFYIKVKNASNSRQVHSIGIQSNHPLQFTAIGKALNSKPSLFAETKIQTILPGQEKEILVSWKDASPESKMIEIIAMFKSAKSEPKWIT